MSNKQQRKLSEGLRRGDLKELVSNVFTVDQFKSKMGEDEDVIVLGFKVDDKFPATDLMEFLERGYPFILDADMSSGEEQDGKYQVFVEIERTPKLPGQLQHLFSGISQLTDCYDWRFRYQRAPHSVPFTEQDILENIPMSPAEYKARIMEFKNTDVREFFDQGVTDVTLESDNTMIFSKPYAGDLDVKFVAIGDYEDVKHTVQGAINLDESSNSQLLFLNKYLGNYDIHKIGNKFLIRNGDKAVVIQKDRW